MIPKRSAPWSTQMKRPCYANAPGCHPEPDRGTQHWCAKLSGHDGEHVCRCGMKFKRDVVLTMPT